MRTAHISRRQAEASFDHAATDDQVFAVQEGAVMGLEREAVAVETEAEIDRLIEEVERELVAEERAEGARLLLDMTDQRRPRRARRRAERVALRALPNRLASRGAVAVMDGRAA